MPGSQIVHTPDSTGPNVATVTVTRPDGVTIVHRQEFIEADADTEAFRGAVTKYGERLVADFGGFARRAAEAAAVLAAEQINVNSALDSRERPNMMDRRGSATRGVNR